MIAALRQCEVVGVATNIAFLERVVAHEAFAGARLDTGLIEKNRDALFPPPGATPEARAARRRNCRVRASASRRCGGRLRAPAIRIRRGTRPMRGG